MGEKGQGAAAVSASSPAHGQPPSLTRFSTAARTLAQSGMILTANAGAAASLRRARVQRRRLGTACIAHLHEPAPASAPPAAKDGSNGGKLARRAALAAGIAAFATPVCILSYTRKSPQPQQPGPYRHTGTDRVDHIGPLPFPRAQALRASASSPGEDEELVIDTARVLTPSAKSQLQRQIRSLQEETGYRRAAEGRRRSPWTSAQQRSRETSQFSLCGDGAVISPPSPRRAARRIRVIAQDDQLSGSASAGISGAEIRRRFRPDDRTVIILVDPTQRSILSFNAGEDVRLKLTRDFFLGAPCCGGAPRYVVGLAALLRARRLAHLPHG